MLDYQWRHDVKETDILAIRKLAEKTGVFISEEVIVAGELVEEKLQKGDQCSYHFLFVEKDSNVIAYSCIGKIPFTEQRYELYWIAVDPAYQKQGLGQEVLVRSEHYIKKLGGKRLYLDTASKASYDPTRRFYEKNGFIKVSELVDFYRDGDSKIIYSKNL